MEQAITARVSLGPEGLRLGGGEPQERVPLLSAALHYFQVPRRHWERCLDAVAGLGLPLVESCVPWSVHELADGALDFEGAGGGEAEQRDLASFLAAAAARGLKVLLRPGPQVNAQLNGLGCPERVLRDERCLARSAQGSFAILPLPPRMFPAPSYASRQFLEEAGRWLLAVAAFLEGRCFPDGPVVALQVDNECCLFFRGGAYDLDYHPDAVAAYREILRERYPAGLPAGYKGARLEELAPPRRFEAASAEELAPHLDWLAAKEVIIARALRTLAGPLRPLGLPLLHNLPPAELGGGVASLPALERELDAVGLDLYARKGEPEAVARSLRELAGSSRFPFVAELGWGGWPYWFPLAEEDSRARALGALMHGARGFNLTMAVERDRWYGAPITALGEKRQPAYDWLVNLIQAVKEVELPALRQPVEVAILKVRDYERLAACSSLLDPAPPAALAVVGLGPEELCSDEVAGLEGAAAPAYARFLRQAEAALQRLQVPYHLLDSEVSEERLRSYRLLVVPALEQIDGALLSRLARFVADGGPSRGVLLGPRAPWRDLRRGELPSLPPHRLAADPAPALDEELARLRIGPDLRSETSGVEVATFVEAGGGPRCLFVASRSKSRVAASITGHGLEGLRASDALSGAPLDLARLGLEPGEIRMVRLGPAARPKGGAT